MDAEISNLEDLHGYVMFAEAFPIAKIHVPYFSWPHRNEALVTKDPSGLNHTRGSA
ncbi:hypothetical protein QTH87_21515 [Variovorax sp. J22P168]|uniref:hypothetical protein n=1 Tax=Variovorax jilinensis TaxID=3053513 RepID=UPI002578F9BD|nr:hypothetical protein [Variovorax sp. J22P168]MDM0015038.1 hypothetical protein [Variovorax sp. J22P168]